MDPTVINAIADGDLGTVRRHRDSLVGEDDLRAFGAAVLHHGGPGFAERLYQDGFVPSGPWPGVDPLVWAADHGVCRLLTGLLFRRAVPATTLRRALEAARAWLDADLETELRRRAGVRPDEVATLERDRVVVDDLTPQTPRIRLSASGGRRSEVLLAHRGAVTVLEGELGLPVSRDELLTRALWSADPDSTDWAHARGEVRRRFSAEANVRWAIGRLADPAVAVRRFVAEVLHHLVADGDGPVEAYAPAASAALLARLAVEPDAAAMDDLIGAYAGLRQHGEVLGDLLPFAGDPRPEVRRRVAVELLNGVDDPPPAVLGALVGLAHDPDPTVRLMATAELVHGPIDTPAVREVLAAHLTGPDRRLRVEAATGLAMRGDPEALARLRELSDEDGYESHAWYQLDAVERRLGSPPRMRNAGSAS